METLGKQVSFQMKIPPGSERLYNQRQLNPQTGIIESFMVKLDNPRHASGYGSNQYDTTHVKVGGPDDRYTLVNTSTSKGGKRKTRKSKQSKKSKKTRKH
jgi:hypothetical protein